MPEHLRSTTLRVVRGLLQIPDTDQLITDTDITDTMIMLALAEFSKRRPRKVVTDYIGNSESNYPLPTYWSDEFSVIRRIYIGEDSSEDDSQVDQNEYKLIDVDKTSRSLSAAIISTLQVTVSPVTAAAYFKDGDVVEIKASALSSGETNWVTADGNSSTGVVALKNAIAATYATPVMRKKKHIRFTMFSFESSDTFRVEYNGLHVHDDSETTVPEMDYSGFCHLIAALSAYAIAAKFSQHTEPALGDADAVDYAQRDRKSVV